MKTLAIIPARGGSKRIPDKNIKPFCGRPMLSHILNAADESDVFDKIHVSTEDEGIAECAANLGYKPDFLRSSDLSDDYTGILPVLRHVVEQYQENGETFDYVALLFATAALTRAEDIKAAYNTFVEGDTASPIMAVAEYPCPPEWAFTMQSDGGLTPQQPGKFSVRSQDLEPAYYDAAMFSFFARDFILTADFETSDQAYRGFIVSEAYVSDIDTLEDWAEAEMKYKILNESA